MRLFKYFSCSPLCIFFVWASHVVAGVTFPVSDVVPTNKRLPVYRVTDRHIVFSKIYDVDITSIKEAKSLGDERLVQPRADMCDCDFASCMVTAFRDHRPVEITPDAVWMVILQGFSAHINENAEKYRDILVSHEGKMTLSVSCDPDSSPEVDHDMSKLFCEAVSKNIKDEKLVGLLSKPFSTSTKDDLTSFQFAVMGSVQEYFEFTCSICSGIPYITLQGTVEDWKDLRRRFSHLKMYDLKEWYDVLDPVLEKFEETAGLLPEKVDKVFWQGMVKYFDPIAGSAPSSGNINGWILNFYPNTRPMFFIRGDLSDPETYKARSYSLDSLPTSRINVPVKFILSGGLEENCVVVSGVMGAQQSPETLALKPVVGWMRGKLKK
ncbi:DUF4419 domain-containing protein [Sansalvadorimonas verongulae]|uniref:DUF4419 domain-containing protein n=1 Tax=Sansalvadorimonas verongulae TaxID=2172824 RepID=UPI0012BC25D1|nr:DUF4419 domain-containing protein [Sansalvadorimonas verongulae]MTI13172.1 DUF4419 domain-containing protein [Sansalvadorimonas verongulae]